MKRLMFLLIGICLSAQAYAVGGVVNVTVLKVQVDQDGKGMVVFSQPVGVTPPACVNPLYANAMSFNMANPGGRGIMALALTAKTSGSTITAYGTGDCTIYGGAWVEDWSYGLIQ